MIELAQSNTVPENVAQLYRDTSGIVSAVAGAVYERLHAVPYLPSVELDSMHPEAHDTSTEGSYTRTIPTLEDNEVAGYEKVHPDDASIEYWRNLAGRRQNEVAVWLYAPTDDAKDEAPQREERRQLSDLLGIANSGLVYVNRKQVRLTSTTPSTSNRETDAVSPPDPSDYLRIDAQAIRVAACILEATSSGWDFNTHYKRDLMTALANQHNALAQHLSSDTVTPYDVGQVRSELLGTKFIHRRVRS
jgi:hypothetical protein